MTANALSWSPEVVRQIQRVLDPLTPGDDLFDAYVELDELVGKEPRPLVPVATMVERSQFLRKLMPILGPLRDFYPADRILAAVLDVRRVYVSGWNNRFDLRLLAFLNPSFPFERYWAEPEAVLLAANLHRAHLYTVACLHNDGFATAFSADLDDAIAKISDADLDRLVGCLVTQTFGAEGEGPEGGAAEGFCQSFHDTLLTRPEALRQACEATVEEGGLTLRVLAKPMRGPFHKSKMDYSSAVYAYEKHMEQGDENALTYFDSVRKALQALFLLVSHKLDSRVEGMAFAQRAMQRYLALTGGNPYVSLYRDLL